MESALRSTICGAGIGAGLMFLFDPARGARRRSMVRDKVVRAAHKTRDAYDATRRNLGNRLSGTAAEVRSQLSGDRADDWTIGERVRAKLGRVTSHPRAITVIVEDGNVKLTGDVLASEIDAIVSGVENVRGVGSVDNRLTTHAAANRVPSLQGGSRRRGWWSAWVRDGWSPTAIAITATGAVAIFAAGLLRVRA
jgi:BON domain